MSLLDVPAQAPLFARKLLAARAAVVRAFEDIGLADVDVQEHGETAATRDYLLQILRAERTGRTAQSPPRDDERLDDFLQAQDRDLLAGQLLIAERVKNADLAARLEVVRARYRAIDCAVCAEERPPCRGLVSDDETVARGGECLKELRELHEWADRKARATYDDACAMHGGGLPTAGVATALETGVVPSGAPVAATRFADAQSPRSVIRLDFPMEVGLNDLATLPYLLVHEALCHAFYHLDASTPRAARPAHDDWAEAWMDCIAFELADRWIGQGPIPSRETQVASHGALRAATRRAHDERYASAAWGRTGNAMRRARERLGAMRARVADCGAEGAWPTMRRAMILLNAVGAPAPTATGVIASGIHFVEAQRCAERDLTAEERCVVTALTRFADHHDPLLLEQDLST